MRTDRHKNLTLKASKMTTEELRVEHAHILNEIETGQEMDLIERVKLGIIGQELLKRQTKQ